MISKPKVVTSSPAPADMPDRRLPAPATDDAFQHAHHAGSAAAVSGRRGTVSSGGEASATSDNDYTDVGERKRRRRKDEAFPPGARASESEEADSDKDNAWHTSGWVDVGSKVEHEVCATPRAGDKT